MSAAEAPPRLRTVFCTSGGLYGALVLRRLSVCRQIEICAVVRSTRVLDRRSGFVRGAWAHLRRSGIAYTLYLWWATTVTDWLCALTGACMVPMRSTRVCRVLSTRDINGPEGRRFLADSAPDLVVSAFFNQRLEATTLQAPRLGCVNVHPSLLPDAKGVDPVFQALLSRSAQLGVTVHLMSPELDAGPILAQRSVEAPEGASLFASTALLFREGSKLLASAIDTVARGSAGRAQISAGDYQSWPTSQELRLWRAGGGALVRVADLLALLRGRSPCRPKPAGAIMGLKGYRERQPISGSAQGLSD